MGEASIFCGLFWLEVAAELLFVAISETMEVGEVVNEGLFDEFEGVEVRIVDEVTEVGGVVAAESSEVALEGGEPAAVRCAPS